MSRLSFVFSQPGHKKRAKFAFNCDADVIVKTSLFKAMEQAAQEAKMPVGQE